MSGRATSRSQECDAKKRHMSTTTSEISEGILRGVIREVKGSYVMYRRRMFPQYKTPQGERWRSVWRKVARLCIERSITPLRLVQVAFDTYHPCPHPNQLLSHRVLDRASSLYTTQEDDTGELKLRLEVDELSTWMRSGRSLRETLLLPSAQLGSLFRYVIASSEGLMDVMGRFRSEAATQLQFAPSSYKRLLPSEHLPST